MDENNLEFINDLTNSLGNFVSFDDLDGISTNIANAIKAAGDGRVIVTDKDAAQPPTNKYKLWIERPGEGETKFKLHAINKAGSGYDTIEIGGSGGRDFNGFNIKEEGDKKYLQLGTWSAVIPETRKPAPGATFAELSHFVDVELPEGGGGSSSIVLINRITPTPVSAVYGAPVNLTVNWSSKIGETVTGPARSIIWTVAGKEVLTKYDVPQGEYTEDLGSYIEIGENQKVRMTIEDIKGTTNYMEWQVTSSVYSVQFTNIDEINYCGNSEGSDEAGSKEVAFKIIGKESKTLVVDFYWKDTEGVEQHINIGTFPDVESTYRVTIVPKYIREHGGPSEIHGAYTIKAYVSVPSLSYSTTPIQSELVWIAGNNITPIIATSTPNITAKQYSQASAKFMALKPNGSGSLYETATIYKKSTHSGVASAEESQTVGHSIQTWKYLCDEQTAAGSPDVLNIYFKNDTETHIADCFIYVTVEKADYNLNIIRENLVVDVDSSYGNVGDKTFGYRKWKQDPETQKWTKYDTKEFTFSENFDWVNGGFHKDENDDIVFIIKRGTNIKFDRSLFVSSDQTDANGKVIFATFKTVNMEQYDCSIASCMKADGASFRMFGHDTDFTETFDEEAKFIKTYYAEENLNEIAFSLEKIEAQTSPKTTVKVAKFWDQGVPGDGKVIANDVSIVHPDQPQYYFTMGSDYCDIYLYKFKIYARTLSQKEMMDCYIANAIQATEKRNRYFANDIWDLDEQGEYVISKSKLLDNCPGLHVITIETDAFPKNKGGLGKTPCKIIHQINRDGSRPNNEQWETYGEDDKGKLLAKYTLQGTSSMAYVDSAANFDLDFKKGGLREISTGAEMSDGYAFNSNHIPVRYFNIKANCASSENANNRCLVFRSNNYDYCSDTYARTHHAKGAKMRNTLYGEPVVIFIKNTGTSALTLTNKTGESYARTVGVGKEIFYCAGDMLNSKKNTEVLGEVYWDGLDGSGGCDFVAGKDISPLPNMQSCIEFGDNNNNRCVFKNTTASFTNKECFEIDPEDAKDQWMATINKDCESVEGWTSLKWYSKEEEMFNEEQFCFRYPEDEMSYGFTLQNAKITAEERAANKIALYNAIKDETGKYSEEQKTKFKKYLKYWNSFNFTYNNFLKLYDFVSNCCPFPRDTRTTIEGKTNPDYCPAGYTNQVLSTPYLSMTSQNFIISNSQKSCTLKRTPATGTIEKVYRTDTTPKTEIHDTYTISGRVVTFDTIPESERGEVPIEIEYKIGHIYDTRAYRLDKFRDGIGDYVNLNNINFHYLFTEFFLLIDNRAKNTFWTYEPMSDGTWKWNVSKNYDNDTAMGNTNKGDLELRYGLEDHPLSCQTMTETFTVQMPETGFIEVEVDNTAKEKRIAYIVSITNKTTGENIESFSYEFYNRKITFIETPTFPVGTTSIQLEVVYAYGLEGQEGDPRYFGVFNAYDSAFWCNIRDTQTSDLETRYNLLDINGCFDAKNVTAEFEAYQRIRPTALMVADAYAKYISPIQIGAYTEDLEGREFGEKINQRRQFLTYQQKYMASKYGSNTASTKYIKLNVAPAPSGQTFSSLVNLTPYSDMYIQVAVDGRAKSTPVRANAGESYDHQFIDSAGNPFVAKYEVDVQMFSGDNYTKVLNISRMFPKLVSFPAGSKAQYVAIGETGQQFTNEKLESFTTTTLPLLKSLNMGGCKNWGGSVSLTPNTILETFNSVRTNAKAITFADGAPLTVVTVGDKTIELRVRDVITPNPTFWIDSSAKIKNLIIEKSLGFPLKDVFTNYNKTIENFRFTGVEFTGDNSFPNALPFVKAIFHDEFERKGEGWKGYDEYGEQHFDRGVMSGNLNFTIISDDELDAVQNYFTTQYGSTLNVTATSTTTDPTLVRVSYKNYNGEEELGYQYLLRNTTIGQNPVSAGLIVTPTKPDSEDGQYYYTYIQHKWFIEGTETEWNFESGVVTTNLSLVPQFTATQYQFVYKFLNTDDTVLFETSPIPWHKNAWCEFWNGIAVPQKEGFVCTGFVPHKDIGTAEPKDGRCGFLSQKNTDMSDPMYWDEAHPYSTTLYPIFEEIKLPDEQKPLNQLSWAQIKAIADQGKAGRETGQYDIYWYTETEEGVRTRWFTLATRGQIDGEGSVLPRGEYLKNVTCYSLADEGSLDGFTYEMQIQDYLKDRQIPSTSNDDTFESYSKIPLTFGTYNLCETKLLYKGRGSAIPEYPWRGSDLRAFLNNETLTNDTLMYQVNGHNEASVWNGIGYIYKLPLDLRCVIESMTHRNRKPESRSEEPISEIGDTTDKLFVPMPVQLDDSQAVVEISSTYSELPNQAQRESYYIYKALSTDRIKKFMTDGTYSSEAYLTSYSSTSQRVCYVTAGGNVITPGAKTYYNETWDVTARSFPFVFAIGTPRPVNE